MSIYFSIYSYINTYIKKIKFNIETIVIYHLFIHNININDFDFNYTLNAERHK